MTKRQGATFDNGNGFIFKKINENENIKDKMFFSRFGNYPI